MGLVGVSSEDVKKSRLYFDVILMSFDPSVFLSFVVSFWCFEKMIINILEIADNLL